MNILYFHQHFSTPKGATGIRSYEMAKHLTQCGHHVTLVCGSYGGANTGLTHPFIAGKRRGIVDGIMVIEFNLACSNQDGLLQRSKMFFSYAIKSIRVLFTEKYDVIFATSTPLTAAIPGIVARWLRRKPFVFEVRDLWPELPKAMGVVQNPVVLSALSLLEWLAYHSAHRLIGLSPGIVKGIEKRGIAEKKITLIPNGCDLNLFALEGSPWRPRGIAADDFLAVYAGTHGPANGLDALLAVAKVLLQRQRYDIKLLLVGQGKMKDHLQQQAKAKELVNIIFHDPIDKYALAGLMKSCNLGLQLLANVPAFYYGTSPNKFFDYIAAGLPVLTNYPGWLAELMTQNDCGYVVPPDNALAFALALEHAADDRALLSKKGQHARQLAEKQFDRKKLAQDFAVCLEGVKPTASESKLNEDWMNGR